MMFPTWSATLVRSARILKLDRLPVHGTSLTRELRARHLTQYKILRCKTRFLGRMGVLIRGMSSSAYTDLTLIHKLFPEFTWIRNGFAWIRKQIYMDSQGFASRFAWIRLDSQWIRMDSQTDKHGFAWIRGFAMDSQGFSRIRDADGFARIRERIRADSHGFSIGFADTQMDSHMDSRWIFVHFAWFSVEICVCT